MEPYRSNTEKNKTKSKNSTKKDKNNIKTTKIGDFFRKKIRQSVTEEQIMEMVEAGNENGAIEEREVEMINNIFDWNDLSVENVMTHRKEIVAVDVNSRIADVVKLAINEGFSRIPVFEDNIDKILGLINVKDLLCLIGCENTDGFTIRQFLRTVIFVPITNKCNKVFLKMTSHKQQLAVVVDEYGGTAGIITIEDLLEEIVGNIQDEYDNEESEITKITENIYTVAGDMNPDDVMEKLGIPLSPGQDYDTMSAFFVDLLGRIPEKDEIANVSYENIDLISVVSEDNWVRKLKLVINSNANEALVE